MLCFLIGHRWLDVRSMPCPIWGKQKYIVERMCTKCSCYKYVRISMDNEEKVNKSMAKVLLDNRQGIS